MSASAAVIGRKGMVILLFFSYLGAKVRLLVVESKCFMCELYESSFYTVLYGENLFVIATV